MILQLRRYEDVHHVSSTRVMLAHTTGVQEIDADKPRNDNLSDFAATLAVCIAPTTAIRPKNTRHGATDA